VVGGISANVGRGKSANREVGEIEMNEDERRLQKHGYYACVRTFKAYMVLDDSD
jgi:hypothetical protein